MTAVHESACAAEFDAQFLDAYTGGDNDVRDQVLKLFLVQSDMLLGRLESAIGSPKAWAEAAHSLKGCARSVGANKVADLAARAEGELSASKSAQIQQLDELRSAFKAASALVEALIRSA